MNLPNRGECWIIKVHDEQGIAMTEPAGAHRIAADEYIAQRLDGQVAWYDGRSGKAKKTYYFLRGVELICAAAVPVVAGFFPSENFLVAILGAVIAVAAGISALGQFHDRWIEYRTTAESLRHQLWLFRAGAEPYDVPEPYSLFVTTVESLISREHTSWLQHQRPSAKQSRGAPA